MATSCIKKDDNKQKWEDTEFPLVCETCLGDSPYVRMTKLPHGKPCAVCAVPFTVFAWQAGTRGRLKKVEICRSCATSKNVCQVCIYDLQYGLPVQVRDKVLAECGDAGGAPGSTELAIPQSDPNRAWYNASRDRAIEAGRAGGTGMVNEEADRKLRAMARMEPRYERNLPKICSFYARGECNRGTTCPFRHVMPRDRDDPLAKQNTKDRFYGSHDPVAEKMIGAIAAKKAERKAELEAAGEVEAVSTLFVRFGEGGGPPPSPRDIRDALYSYGEIASVRMAPDGKGCFVEYTSRAAAGLAMSAVPTLTIGGRSRCIAHFARQAKRGRGEQGRGGGPGATVPTGPMRPLPPPTNAARKSGAGGDGLAPLAAPVVPAGFVPFKRPAGPPPPVAVGAPRPGGGPIRNVGRKPPAPTGPYYPSQDPSRLGTGPVAAVQPS